jgi:hypothetical protein
MHARVSKGKPRYGVEQHERSPTERCRPPTWLGAIYDELERVSFQPVVLIRSRSLNPTAAVGRVVWFAIEDDNDGVGMIGVAVKIYHNSERYSGLERAELTLGW